MERHTHKFQDSPKAEALDYQRAGKTLSLHLQINDAIEESFGK